MILEVSLKQMMKARSLSRVQMKTQIMNRENLVVEVGIVVITADKAVAEEIGTVEVIEAEKVLVSTEGVIIVEVTVLVITIGVSAAIETVSRLMSITIRRDQLLLLKKEDSFNRKKGQLLTGLFVCKVLINYQWHLFLQGIYHKRLILLNSMSS